jgi:hypothetical protein
MEGIPDVTQSGPTLSTRVRLDEGGELVAEFQESDIAFRLRNTPPGHRLGIVFEWASAQAAFRGISAGRLHYRFRDFDYSMRVANGSLARTSRGATVTAIGRTAVRLQMAQ